MTDNEIIKSFECCEANEGNRPNCKECPYFWLEEKPVDCHKRTRRQALDLINRQQAEIERLKKENEILSANADNAFQEGLNENRDLFKCEVKEDVYIEAIKKFSENLKTVAVIVQIGPDPSKKHKVVTVEGIDTVAKKYLGDINAETTKV